MLLRREMHAAPGPFLQALAPSREDVVVCVECRSPGTWRADLCAPAGLPVVLGHALSMKAIHGGKATRERSDAPKIAVLRRGGLLPQASVSPAAMRASRALLRRRLHRMRHRAGRLAHSQQTNRQDHRPQIGKTRAYKANRGGVAARLGDPAVQQSRAVAPTWAFSEAAVLSGRNHPAGPNSRARLAKHPGKGNALTVLAHPRGRAVDDRVRRETAFDLANFVSAAWRGTSAPAASRDAAGLRPRSVLWQS